MTLNELDGKDRTIGRYDDEREAAYARNKAVLDAGLEGRRRMNAVDEHGVLVPPGAPHRRAKASVIAPDPLAVTKYGVSKYWGVTWARKQSKQCVICVCSTAWRPHRSFARLTPSTQRLPDGSHSSVPTQVAGDVQRREHREAAHRLLRRPGGRRARGEQGDHRRGPCWFKAHERDRRRRHARAPAVGRGRLNVLLKIDGKRDRCRV